MIANHFSVRALELHSLYAWDYEWIMKCLDFMTREGYNTLILHRNDIIDLIIYPGKYFGCGKEHYESIFERYAEIFRTLYRYTPTRRSGPYQRRSFLKRVIFEAHKRNIRVFLENKELYFPDIMLEFHPETLHDGKICATDPFWPEFTKVKYRELFEEFPELDGVITSPATGESRVSIKSNRCTCERCRNTTKQEWYESILMAMYESVSSAGKEMVVRDFVFDSRSQNEIASEMENLPEDVIISLKNTPHDYYPTFPDNCRIGCVGHHRQWVEYDAMGQYFGWGIGIADLRSDYRRRFRHALEKGAEGMIVRTDWESLDGHTCFRTMNLMNLYSAAALAMDTDVTDEEIVRHYLVSEGYISESGESDETIKWFSGLMAMTWPIISRTCFAGDCVFSDSSLMPVSFEHAFWLSEEKNSLKDWAPEKADALFPSEARVKAILREKDVAHELAVKALESAGKDVTIRHHERITDAFSINLMYVNLFVTVTDALILTRYLTETVEPVNTEFFSWAESVCDEKIAELKNEEKELRKFFRTTSFHPHTVYTLLDPDRVRCLYLDLERRLENVRSV
ncbi:MAG: hypothetical protein ACI4NM_07020 [Bullifex sp.]